MGLKKIIQGNERTKRQKIDLGKITNYFENHFTDPEAEEIAKEPTSCFRQINESEVREAVKKLSNKMNSGPKELTPEDLKNSDTKTDKNTEWKAQRDEKLTSRTATYLRFWNQAKTEPNRIVADQWIYYPPTGSSSIITLKRISPKSKHRCHPLNMPTEMGNQQTTVC